MVRIRLRRTGARHQPSYRIVAAEKKAPRDGRFLEILGHYNPRTEPATVEIDESRLFHWLGNGAQPSRSVHKILKPLGTWDRWQRFKDGEDLETLLAEAKEAMPEADPRTRRDDLVEVQKKSVKQEKPAPPVEVEEDQEESAPETPPQALADESEGEEQPEAGKEESTEESTS